jgi:ribosomal protein L11 methyltransferase
MMNNDSWLEISLVVDGELAEAVAEVLARFLPNGVAIESTSVQAGPDGAGGQAVGPLRVCGYLRVDDQLEEKRQKIEEALWYLGRIQVLPQAQYQTIQSADWADAWKAHYHPIQIGTKLVIVPAWLDNPSPKRIEIRMDPGMAFGTGTHPTTQLCLEYLENLCQTDMDVIDMGCGSGILSVAGLKLGAGHALGVDIDIESVNASKENAQLNNVSQNFEVGLGSLTEIINGEFSIRQARLVIANILAPVIIRLMDDGLGKLVKQDGMLVLSGIIEEQAQDVEAALTRNGFHLVSRKQIEDWVALCARPLAKADS